jgi:hypothetical protein
MEEHTTFCPSCGAPQIKVATPEDSLTNQPSTPPLPPGTPDSVQPPALPLQLVPAGQIQWKKFRRMALLLSVISGAALVFLGPIGVLVLLADVVIAVSRYRRYHPGPLFASHGARLGAFAGFLSFIIALILSIPLVVRNSSEIHRQILVAIQQRTAGNPDPRAQQLGQWMATNQGMWTFIVFSMVLALILCLVLSSATGALTAAFSGNRQRH